MELRSGMVFRANRKGDKREVVLVRQVNNGRRWRVRNTKSGRQKHYQASCFGATNNKGWTLVREQTTSNKEHPEWEVLKINSFREGEQTERIRVPGGWIYRLESWDEGDPPTRAVALCFVPGGER
jgi:hypothetical protein